MLSTMISLCCPACLRSMQPGSTPGFWWIPRCPTPRCHPLHACCSLALQPPVTSRTTTVSHSTHLQGHSPTTHLPSPRLTSDAKTWNPLATCRCEWVPKHSATITTEFESQAYLTFATSQCSATEWHSTPPPPSSLAFNLHPTVAVRVKHNRSRRR